MIQSAEEIRRVFTDFFENVAPANLIQNEANAMRLAEYVRDQRHGLVSIGNLKAGLAALQEQLEFVQEKSKAEIQKERDDRNNRKQRQQAFDSAHQNSHQKAGEERRQDHLAEAEQKRRAQVQSKISGIINSYVVGHPSGGIQYARMQEGQEKLRAIKVHTNGQYDVDATLRAVEEAFARLP